MSRIIADRLAFFLRGRNFVAHDPVHPGSQALHGRGELGIGHVAQAYEAVLHALAVEAPQHGLVVPLEIVGAQAGVVGHGMFHVEQAGLGPLDLVGREHEPRREVAHFVARDVPFPDQTRPAVFTDSLKSPFEYII